MRRETNRFMMVSIVITSVVIISLIVFLIANAARKNEEDKFAEELSSFDKSSMDFESASSQIGKSVEESKDENEEEFTSVEVSENTKNNTTTKTNTNVENKTSEQTNKENKVKETNATETKKEKNDEVKFEAPLKGEILREFAKDSLVFSNTLQEWIIHYGVDVKADKTTVVKSAAEGTVASIKNDPRYGLTVIINHDNGYQTVYSNLLTAEFVVKGEKIEKGQSIGTVGNSASFEVSDDYHLHFELLKNNEYLDPTIYMSFE